MGNYYGISESLTTLIEGVAARLPEGIVLSIARGRCCCMCRLR